MPKRNLIDIAAFRSEASSGAKPEAGIFRMSAEEAVPAADGSRKIRFCFSDDTVDRAGDSISADGWQIDGFMKNPVALWAHESSEPPIGRASNIGPAGGKFMGDIEFMPADMSPFADSIYRMVRGKFINAVSVGFLPIEWSFVNDKDRPFGMEFRKQELLEISVCPVPCNPNALVEARAKGIDTGPLREWAERLLDGDGFAAIPRKLLAETFRLAKTPASTRKKYLPPKAGEKDGGADWKVGANRDLPIDDSESWDGPAAEASIFAHAGGDDFDPAKARGGFLIYDAAAPKLKGSYKLPFAHVVGGEMKAVKGGVRAAASRLPQTDASQSALDEARKVIDHYETRMGDGGKSAARRSGTVVIPNDPAAASDGLPPGNCGRASAAECGMKDPKECAMHRGGAGMDDPEGSAAEVPLIKAGRRISAANVEKLAKARAHIDDVLQSNDASSDVDDDITDPVVDPDADSKGSDPRAKARDRLVQLLH